MKREDGRKQKEEGPPETKGLGLGCSWAAAGKRPVGILGPRRHAPSMPPCGTSQRVCLQGVRNTCRPDADEVKRTDRVGHKQKLGDDPWKLPRWSARSAWAVHA